MTELGIKCQLVLYIFRYKQSPLFYHSLHQSNINFLIFPCTCLFTFCNIIMTGFITQLEESVVPGLLFLSKCLPK